MINLNLLYPLWLSLNLNLISAFSCKIDHCFLSNVSQAKSITESLISQNQADLSLFEAVKSGEDTKVKMLLDAGYDPNLKQDGGLTPIFFAPNKQIAKLLIEAGADLNVKDRDNRTALFHIKDRDALIYIIEQGADVNNVDTATGETLLHSVSDAEVARLLLEKGADANARGGYGATPLHKNKNADVNQVLIDYGADLNALNDFNMKSTPLEYALSIQTPRANPERIKVLLNSGAKLYPINGYQPNPLFLVRSMSIDVARVLIDSGADVKARGYQGRTVLFDVNDTELAKFFVSLGVDVQAEDENGNTALFHARNDSMVKFLIAHGAKINHQNHNNETPLLNATRPQPYNTFSDDDKELIRVLVENGADVNAKDSLNRTPLSAVVMERDTATIEYLIKNGANTKDLDYRVIEQKYSDFSRDRLYQVKTFLYLNRFEDKY